MSISKSTNQNWSSMDLTISGQIILLNFVDPYQPWIHTNSIEREWRRLRNKISNVKRTFSDDIIKNYLDSFVIKTMLTSEEL